MERTAVARSRKIDDLTLKQADFVEELEEARDDLAVAERSLLEQTDDLRTTRRELWKMREGQAAMLSL